MKRRSWLAIGLLLSSLVGVAFAEESAPVAADSTSAPAPAVSGEKKKPEPIPEALLTMNPKDPKIIQKAIDDAKKAFLSEDPKQIVKLMTAKCSRKWGAKLQKMKKDKQLALIGKNIAYVESWYGMCPIIGQGFPLNGKLHVLILAKEKNSWKIAAIYDRTDGLKSPIE